jgi:hypothetical protein
MESLRTLQQRALRQLLTTRRATLSHQTFRQLSQSAPRAAPRASPCKLSTRPSQPFAKPSRPRPRKPQSHAQRRHQSTTAAPENDASLSLSGRLRKLSREYGWSALGVYLLLSALDFPFCFLAVRTLGTDRIGRWEHIVLGYIKSVIPESVLERVQGIKWPWGAEEVKEKVEMEVEGKRILEENGGDYKHEPREGEELFDHGVETAEKANSGDNASMCYNPQPLSQYTDILQVYGHSSPLPTRSTNPSSSCACRSQQP